MSKRKVLLLHVLPIILSLIIGAVVSYFAGQDHNWDLLNYHFYNPYAFLHHRDYFDFAPAGLQTFLNPALDIIPYLLIRHLPAVGAGMLIGAFQGLSIWLVYEISLIILNPYLKGHALNILAFVIGAASFFGAGNLSEVGATMGDNSSGIFVLIGLLLYLLSRTKRFNKKYIYLLRWLGFLSVGLAVGLKLTNTPYAIALIVLDLISWNGWRDYLKNIALDGCFMVLGILASFGFWSAYLYKRFHNPIFPYYNTLFHSPYYANVNFTDPRFFPHGLLQTIFYPFFFDVRQHLAAEVYYRDIRLSVLYALIVLLILVCIVLKLLKKKVTNIPKSTVYLLVFLSVGYILWEYKFSIYRYLIPIEILSLVAIASIIFNFIRRPALSSAIVVGLISIITVLTIPMNWGRVPWQKTFLSATFPFSISKNGLIVLAGSQPEAYMVPFMPPTDPVIRIDSSLDYGHNTLVNSMLNGEISYYFNSHKPLYGIISDTTEAKDYSQFNLVPYHCAPIKTDGPVTPEPISLCDLKRTQ